jgi:RNA polymerase sigma-70 factor (ECF subfamily)
MEATKTPGAGRRPIPEDVFCTPPLSAEQVYHAYAPRVYNTARKMLRSHFDAEDVTQDVLLKVVRKLPTFRGESAFPTWLHRVTVNTALSHRRRQAVRLEYAVREPLDTFVTAGRHDGPGPRRAAAPEAQLADRETRRLIDGAIAALPPIYRTVFVLADVEGLANAAIADTLGLSVPAIKSRLHRARLLMRHALAPYFADPPWGCPDGPAGRPGPAHSLDG